MINEFFTTVRQDLLTIINFAKQKNPQNDEQERRICLVALRMLSVLGMAFGFYIMVKAWSFIGSAPVNTALQTTCGFAFYAISHDVFVMSKNVQFFLPHHDIIKSIPKIFRDACHKVGIDYNYHPRRFLTIGTVFRPIWDASIEKILE